MMDSLLTCLICRRVAAQDQNTLGFCSTYLLQERRCGQKSKTGCVTRPLGCTLCIESEFKYHHWPLEYPFIDDLIASFGKGLAEHVGKSLIPSGES